MLPGSAAALSRRSGVAPLPDESGCLNGSSGWFCLRCPSADGLADISRPLIGASRRCFSAALRDDLGKMGINCGTFTIGTERYLVFVKIRNFKKGQK